MDKHRIVVSAENTPYAAWQAKLFCYSCLHLLQHSPLIVVHESGRELHADYQSIVKAGAAVLSIASNTTLILLKVVAGTITGSVASSSPTTKATR